MSLAKKDVELAYLEGALADLGITAEKIDAREAPDFLIRLGDGRVVAVEVTQLITPHLAAGKAALGRLRAELERRIGAKGLALHVHLFAFLGATGLLGDRDVFEAHLEALLELIASGPGDYEEQIDVRAHAIRSMVVNPHDDPNRAQVSMTTFSEGRRPRLPDVVRVKETRLPAYRAAVPTASEHWLLLVAPGGVAGAVERSDVWKQEVTTSFDAVIFHDRFRERNHPLGVPHTFFLKETR